MNGPDRISANRRGGRRYTWAWRRPSGRWAPVGAPRRSRGSTWTRRHRPETIGKAPHSRDGVAGPNGLLELRAFERSPRPRTASVQALLLRAPIAAFWWIPYMTPLDLRLHSSRFCR
ncbi:MAG: transglutaminase family protein [Polyangiaceae bacterium]|nr:transglutaminase family protein [Polyangiaceae bacterium]